jgi:hypothetical protein
MDMVDLKEGDVEMEYFLEFKARSKLKARQLSSLRKGALA